MPRGPRSYGVSEGGEGMLSWGDVETLASGAGNYWTSQ